jgi:hypothetical protein
MLRTFENRGQSCLLHAAFLISLLFYHESADYVFLETSVDFCRTARRYIPEGRRFHNNRRENLNPDYVISGTMDFDWELGSLNTI